MDWDAMIADLESSFDAERRADLVAQSAELAEAEQASIAVVDRLRGSSPLTSSSMRGRGCRPLFRWGRWPLR